VVRITGFHPVGPGSIPGMGIIFARTRSSRFVDLYENHEGFDFFPKIIKLGGFWTQRSYKAQEIVWNPEVNQKSRKFQTSLDGKNYTMNCILLTQQFFGQIFNKTNFWDLNEIFCSSKISWMQILDFFLQNPFHFRTK
jgi:hypothetical protein